MNIRVVTAPTVEIIGRQGLDLVALDRFLAACDTPPFRSDAPSAAEALVEVAGRLCYWSFKYKRPGGNATYIDHILDVGHGSVVEHAVWTVLIAGVSRSLTHELIRHRVGLSPSQLSQRFYDESDCAFVLPPLIPNDLASESYNAWLSGCRESLTCYTQLCKALAYAGPIRAILDATMRKKRIREAARSVLSNSVETRIALTGNARAWRWFCSLRGAEAADLEIRRLAAVLANRFKIEAPNLFHDVKVSRDDNDWPIVIVGHPKV